MSYRIEMTGLAEKNLARLSRAQPEMARKLARAIDHLSVQPEAGIPLTGELKGCYKYRVGVYRIVYQIFRQKLLIVILDVDHRKDVYR